jgi:signal transduction histidine kinase/CheY-like chemotaxis protein
MSHWFASLRLPRKLLVIALVVTTAALAAAIVGLTAFDSLRVRSSAGEDARALAQLVAENSSGAILFNDSAAAQLIADSVRVRPVVALVCLYRSDGSLVASLQREDERCPAVPQDARTWHAVAAYAPVRRNDQIVGGVLVERTLSDLTARILVTLAAGAAMLLIAAALAVALANRMQGLVSRPIVELAAAARSVGPDDTEMPPVRAPPDETGDLVRAFEDMVRRLTLANQALRREVDERARVEAERETILARERQASRLKDEFLAAVSHELRTPLTAILGWTHILAHSPPSQETIARAVSSLARSAQAQQRVIEDLLDVSRAITGKLELSLARVDVRPIVEAAVDGIRPAAGERHLALETEMPDHPCLVMADADRLRQVIDNLLSNAVKFTPAGSIRASVAERGSLVDISVTDTGVGISSQFLPHVFERFRQADGSTTREYGGLGLGLAIVRELTEQHGGSVSARSDGPQQGATFTITLPRLLTRAAGEPAPALVDVDRDHRLDGVTILAVDDDPDALEVLATTLMISGAVVERATSGAKALDLFSRRPVDIVLTDVAMPRMDGFALLREVRRRDTEAHRKTPVFAVSAYASTEDRRRCQAAGFDAHVGKPFDPDDLVRLVATAAAAESQ